MTSINNNELDSFIQMYRDMVKIRFSENLIADGRKNGLIGGPVHLGVGQEAIPVGLSKHLHSYDKIFGAHRSHSHIIALGTNLVAFFSEILGRADGLCGGFGGSMHLSDPSVGFMGSVPIVAGTVPLALGAGLACKFDSKGAISVSYLGDGAIEEGVVQESLNIAVVQQIPCLFLVENNLFASHMDIDLRQPNISTLRFGVMNQMKAVSIDGNNAIIVSDTCREIVQYIRSTGKPAFVECNTYRWFGHVDWRDDIDVGVKRSQDDILKWKMRDPVLRLKNHLINEFFIDEMVIENIDNEVSSLVNDAWLYALSLPKPCTSNLLKNVYRSNI
jgi:TPP-dependent pyruvate/acetoin dehydrogenase alpha subunit